MSNFRRILCTGILIGWAFSPVFGEWPEFRGLLANGHHSKPLPREWSEDKNITWRKEIEGKGWSTPVILNGKIWLTTASIDGRQMSVLCLDSRNGDVLFDRLLVTDDNPEPLSNNMNTYATPSAVLEPGRVWVTFGASGTFCLDSETCEIIWQRRDLSASHWRGSGSSPVIFENLLVLTHDGADQQYHVALDKETGDTVWRTDRSTKFEDEKDGRPANSGDMRKAYSTPIFVKVGDQVQMICNAAKACWAYDAKTGDEIWNVHYKTHSPSSRPVYSDDLGMVFVNTGLGKAEVWAIRLEPGMSGNVEDSHVAWKLLKRTPKRSSPVVVEGLFFMANDGIISCVDAKSGEVLWAERAGADYSASVLTAGGLIYFCDEEGLTTVVKASKTFEKVAENHLDGGMMASPAAAGNSLFLRTKTHLYRIDE
ncbi:MAG: PQQ-binding-like beta-propeller repeat protein [Verrucomicrobiales bacterium]|nr:PQQ-binding-like beta-propeller repeat protein [Verrucomicrobiales bacterium]